MNPGGTNERFVRDRSAKRTRRGARRQSHHLRALAAGEADVMITDAVEARLEAGSNPALCVADPPPLFEEVSKAYLISKDPRWQAWLDDGSRAWARAANSTRSNSGI